MSADAVKCPSCKDGVLKVVDEMLDQSGLTHLPTTAYVCVNSKSPDGKDIGCGYKRWEPAKDVDWATNIVKDPLTGEVLSKPRNKNP